jgi:hypothetical protein
MEQQAGPPLGRLAEGAGWEGGEVRGLCYGVKRGAARGSGTSQKPTNTNTKSNTNQKQLITRSYSVRGDFWGMHRIDFKGLSILGLSTVR